MYATDGVSSVYKITGGILTPQTHHFVKKDATGANDGSSWIDAYTDFQVAIDAAQSGDSIFVAATATPYQPAGGGSFTMKEGVKIFGGFLGTEADFSQRNLANKPTLQGNGNSVISNINNGLTAAAVLDGLIITGGYANRYTNGDHGGGGIYNNNVSPTLRNLVITANGCNSNGGGIACIGGSLLLEHVLISDNTADIGGGGISCQSTSLTLRDVLISRNSASSGGGIWTLRGSVTLTNVTISGNTANQAGGGIYVWSDFTVYNSILWGNSAVSANEIYMDLLFIEGRVTLHHSLYRNGDANVNDNHGFLIATDNDLTVSPQFVDSAGGNYQLTAASPCIDAGTPDTTGLNIGNSDLAGNARVIGSAIDIGAYEFDATLPVTLIDFTGKLQNNIADLEWQTGVEEKFNYFELQKSTNGKSFSTVATLNAKGNNSHYTVNVPQTASKAYYRLKIIDNNSTFKYSPVITLSQNASGNVSVYPNPAKDYININAGQAGNVGIYSVSGVLVRMMKLQAGINRIDINDLASGSYFIVSANNRTKFVKR